jgi:hypothetical protein
VHCKSFPGKQLRRLHDANADVPTTCGIAVFIVILARCRIVEKNDVATGFFEASDDAVGPGADRLH